MSANRSLCAALVVLVGGAACLKNNVYTYPVGDVHVVVTNNNTFAVCAFNILTEPASHVVAWDPLKLKHPPAQLGPNDSPPSDPVEPLKSGGSVEVSLKKATYRFESTACESELGGNLDVVLDGPLAISLGPPRQPAPAGHKSVTVSFGKPAYRDMSCIPDGEWRDYQGPECCTNAKHYSSQLGRYVCGP